MGSVEFNFQSVFNLAKKSLETNIVTLSSGSYLSAGSRQYQTLWTRDFCFSVKGLLALGRADVVENHLSRLLSFRREGDFLIPKAMDSVFPPFRVVNVMVSNWLSFWPAQPAALNLREPLKPQFLDENVSKPMDSNLLVLLAALNYLKATGNVEWWNRHEQFFMEIFSFYDLNIDDQLVVQGRFSDWQDSVSRVGKSLYINILYYAVCVELFEFPGFQITKEKLEKIRSKIDEVFFDQDSGVYRSLKDQEHVSLDGNLLAIDLGYLKGEQAKRLYEKLVLHPLWTRNNGIPGYCTYPDYPASSHSWQIRLAGLSHYHDSLHWSWLMALAAKVAYRLSDERTGDRILAVLAKAAKRDGGIAEIYDSKLTIVPPGEPWPIWSSLGYRSEEHFSWGAACTIEALAVSGRLEVLAQKKAG